MRFPVIYITKLSLILPYKTIKINDLIMITTPICAKLECLELAFIMHDLFISETYREVHIWKTSDLEQSLTVLHSREIKLRSIVRNDDGDNSFYIIRF